MNKKGITLEVFGLLGIIIAIVIFGGIFSFFFATNTTKLILFASIIIIAYFIYRGGLVVGDQAILFFVLIIAMILILSKTGFLGGSMINPPPLGCSYTPWNISVTTSGEKYVTLTGADPKLYPNETMLFKTSNPGEQVNAVVYFNTGQRTCFSCGGDKFYVKIWVECTTKIKISEYENMKAVTTIYNDTQVARDTGIVSFDVKYITPTSPEYSHCAIHGMYKMRSDGYYQNDYCDQLFYLILINQPNQTIPTNQTTPTNEIPTIINLTSPNTTYTELKYTTDLIWKAPNIGILEKIWITILAYLTWLKTILFG